MSDRGYQIRNQNGIHFITFATVQWIDVFTRKEYAEVIIESLKYCQQKKGLNVHAWVLMTNHIHLIISTVAPYKLSDVLRDFKKFTSSKIIQAIQTNPKESRKNWMLWIFKKAGERNNRNKEYQLWQQDNHPIECDTNSIIDSRLQYIHENPVRAGFVRCEQDYRYSSAIDYYTDDRGLIEIERI